jgi:hypothetical protein
MVQTGQANSVSTLGELLGGCSYCFESYLGLKAGSKVDLMLH